jgi:hypothetical protein
MLNTWRLSESHYALFTDKPHVETATMQAALSHMADYAKDNRLLTMQYAGPEKVFVIGFCTIF